MKEGYPCFRRINSLEPHSQSITTHSFMGLWTLFSVKKNGHVDAGPTNRPPVLPGTARTDPSASTRQVPQPNNRLILTRTSVITLFTSLGRHKECQRVGGRPVGPEQKGHHDPRLSLIDVPSGTSDPNPDDMGVLTKTVQDDRFEIPVESVFPSLRRRRTLFDVLV